MLSKREIAKQNRLMIAGVLCSGTRKVAERKGLSTAGMKVSGYMQGCLA
jgi:hypothetical protein